MELYKLINIWLASQEYNNVFVSVRWTHAYIYIIINKHEYDIAVIGDSWIRLENGEKINASDPELFDKLKQYLNEVIIYYR